MGTSTRLPLQTAATLLGGVLLLLAGPVTLAGTGPAAIGGMPAYADPTPVPGTSPPTVPPDLEAPVTVEVTTLAPRAPEGDDPVQVAGRLVNSGAVPLRGLRVQLRLGGVLTSRSELAEADREPPATFPRGLAKDAARTDLAPGAATSFDLRTTVSELRLQRLGVYPLEVEARAVVGAEPTSTQVGLASTYVPFFPQQRPARTRVAWLWPLVDAPRQAPDGRLVDDGLAAGLSPNGRLGRLTAAAHSGVGGTCDPVAARAPVPPGSPARPKPKARPTPCLGDAVPMTYAVDPALLDDVRASTRPYAVLDGQRTVVGAGGSVAAAWLTGLTADVARTAKGVGNAVLALPYADPDVVALSRRPALRDDVTKADTLGQRTAADILGGVPLAGVAWPPAGPLSSDALDAVVGSDVGTVVLDEAALPPPATDFGRTPDARARLSSAVAGQVTGLVVDGGLSRLLAAPVTQGGRLAEQRWLVETAMIAAERPTEARTLLVAPPRTADLQPAVAAAEIADTGRVPWLCPVSVRDVVAGRDACPGAAPPTQDRAAEDRGALALPRDAAGELDASYLRRVEATGTRATQLTDDVLASSQAATATKTALLKARLRTESAAWRAEPDRGRRLLALLEDDVDALRGKVVVSSGPRVLLTSRTGTIRLAVTNRLDQTVTVGVRVSATNMARLSTEAPPVVEIGPNRSVPVQIQVRAATSGQFVVYAQLVDRQRRSLGDRRELVVRSTRYGRFALAVTGLGAAVLLVAAGTRITRRALGRPRSGGSAAAEPADGPAERPPAPDQPS